MDPLPPEIWDRLVRRLPADERTPLFGPLLAGPSCPDGTFVLGRIAQSLDGFIAMPNGESHWISGEADIVHTHRLRALFDAIVVGAGTVLADDPQLTTRLVPGPSPVRVVIDPARRLESRHRVFAEGPETLLICAAGVPGEPHVGRAEAVPLPSGRDGIDVRDIVAELARRGLRRIFVEGGGVTVSRFLAAGALDRLHVTVAPLVMGQGIPAFALPPVAKLADGRRFGWTVHQMGADILLDIPLVRRA
jgi:riboflavin-specific deaminase-like protein